MNYLWFDTETGGLDCKKSPVLTMYFAVCNKDLNIIDELDLKVKPDSLDNFIIEEGAMKTNGIDLEKHMADPETISYEVAKQKILELIERNKIKGKRKSFVQAGHNLPFDRGFIFEHIMTQEEFEKDVHYRILDTSSITTFLKDVGIFPDHLGSLVSLVEYFKIPMKEAHTAKDDVQMNIDVYKKIKELLSKAKSNMAGLSQNLLSIIEG